MRVLITGADGMLGGDIKKALVGHNVCATNRKSLDVTKIEDFRKHTKFNPDFIIHLAAITDLEYCEKHPEEAYYVNHVGSLNMVMFAEQIGAKVIYLGTTNIFDGKDGMYAESETYSKANPLNVYGRSKLYGENSALYQIPFKTWVIRAGWMFGGGYKKEKKFVKKMFDQLKKTRLTHAVNDLQGSLTYTGDVARFIQMILDKKVNTGIYNIACRGIATRYKIACLMVEKLGMGNTVTPQKNEFFKKKFSCVRPKKETLDLGLYHTNNFETRSWDSELIDYLKREYERYVN